ncbi:polysaccharide deacetylase family protein [Alteromonadaceae bacterium BrNp21-10]|nr:polysaccharide deacetylase family protein [Alteromonadaceae bacterium BrNp21-10]
MRHLFTLAVLALFASGCSTTTSTMISSDKDFYIVQASGQDNYSTLAEKYLGNSEMASVIQRYNPSIDIMQGSKIAIPKHNHNASSVFSNGYQQIPILCYHQFTDDDQDRSKMVVSKREFEEQMAYLKENNYQVVSLREVSAFLKGEQALPDNAVVITVDDGYRSYFEVAYPILKKYGFASTMFVYPDFIGAGLALSWKQVKALEDDPLVDIESHSKSHDSLSIKPNGESEAKYNKRLKEEVETTDRIFKRRIGKRSLYFAYPYGNSSKQLVELLAKNNYALAMTVKKGSNPSFASQYLLNRTMIYGKDSLSTFKKSLKVFQESNLK